MPWRDGLVVKMLAIQVQRPEFKFFKFINARLVWYTYNSSLRSWRDSRASWLARTAILVSSGFD